MLQRKRSGNHACRAKENPRSGGPRTDQVEVEGGVLGAGFAGAVLVEAAVLVVVETDLVDDVEVEEEDLLEELEYKSAYQPPPLRMKFPEETRRLALF